MKHLKSTFVGLLALTAASDAFAFGPPGPLPMGGGLPAPQWAAAAALGQISVCGARVGPERTQNPQSSTQCWPLSSLSPVQAAPVRRRNVGGSHGAARNPGSRGATTKAATGSTHDAAAAILSRGFTGDRATPAHHAHAIDRRRLGLADAVPSQRDERVDRRVSELS